MSGQSVKITLLLFGSCREAAGTAEIKLELAEPATAATAWAEVKRRYPILDNFDRSVLVAVNEEHAKMDRRLFDGDTVAVFPPVSGGEH